jgi:hypothetical protein
VLIGRISTILLGKKSTPLAKIGASRFHPEGPSALGRLIEEGTNVVFADLDVLKLHRPVA